MSSNASYPLFLSAGEVTELANWNAMIGILRSAYGAEIAPGMIPSRSIARGSGVWLRSMTAISPLSGLLGCKLIGMNTSTRTAGYLIVLLDPSSIEVCSLMDGNTVTGLRTAATSALATDILARPGGIKVASLGAGFEARGHVEALASIRPISSLRVFSPTPQRRAQFAQAICADLGIDATAAEHPQDAVRGSDVVICAARSKDETPILLGDWLEPGMTIVSIGSTVPEQREVDVEVVRRSALVVADVPHEVAHDTGDMRECTAAGVSFEGKLTSLADVVSGRCTARRSVSDILLYKSVGSALQDIVVAEHMFSTAITAGVGRRLAFCIEPVIKR